MHPAVIIVGTGLAGYSLAREFRKRDAETPLIIISRDHAGFYSKPMLSNALAGNKTTATLLMKTAEKMATELNATIMPFTELAHIDSAARRLQLTNGECLMYRDLALALGADPIRITLTGDGAEGVLSVNDLDDFARFAEALNSTADKVIVKRVAILGAGLIGCEFANDLLARNIKPIVLDLADRALNRLLPPEASALLQSKLEQAGVEFHFGVSVDAVDKSEADLQLHLSDGTKWHADLVLSAIGLKPRVGLAESAGLAVKRGIVVDQFLQTNAEHIYALGDAAEVSGLNLPYVLPIMQQARALAATLSGAPTAVSYPAMPVVVKTPACPTVVCPPPAEAYGHWLVEQNDDGLVAKFIKDAMPEQLLGFVLQGKATSQRQALAMQVPALL